MLVAFALTREIQHVANGYPAHVTYAAPIVFVVDLDAQLERLLKRRVTDTRGRAPLETLL